MKKLTPEYEFMINHHLATITRWPWRPCPKKSFVFGPSYEMIASSSSASLDGPEVGDDAVVIRGAGAGLNMDANHDFIVAAPEIVECLLAEVRALRTENASTAAERDAQGLFLRDARRARAELERAIQSDAPDGTKFEGVFADKSGDLHLGYRHPGSDEVISPWHLSEPFGEPQLREMFFFYKVDNEDPDEPGDERHQGLVINENDYIDLQEQRILPKHTPFKAAERDALRAAYVEFVLNTQLISDDSAIGRQRTLLADLLRGWGVEVPA